MSSTNCSIFFFLSLFVSLFSMWTSKKIHKRGTSCYVLLQYLILCLTCQLLVLEAVINNMKLKKKKLTFVLHGICIFWIIFFFFLRKQLRAKAKGILPLWGMWFGNIFIVLFTLPADLQTSWFHQVLVALLMLSLPVFLFWAFVSLQVFACASALI